MVNQGDIIYLDFNPSLGSEQKGYRPALIISNDTYNQKTNHFALALPITSTKSSFPLHIELPINQKIKGYIMCEQVKMIDLKARSYKKADKLSKASLDKVLKIVKLMF
jgi:mRNA interferase MazF